MTNKFTTTLLMLALFTPVFVNAQNEAPENGADKKAKKTENTETSPEKKDDGAKVKDRQNQTEFFKPDMEASQHNFYKRRDISTPLQPSYDQDSAVYQKGKKREKQQQSYINNQYLFPAKPKNQWELGINFGSAFISGDVKPYVHIKGLIQNIGAGFTVRKAFGYMGSIRFGYNFYMTTGRNWEPDENLQFNQALRGRYDSRVNYWNNPRLMKQNTTDSLNMNKMFFYNYRTYMHEVHVAGVLSFGNINFHKERNIISFYLLGGASAAIYTTYMDALNSNGDVHDFSHVHSLFYNATANNNVTAALDKRKEALKRLDNILDGKYESKAERENNVPGIKGWGFLPSGTVGGGIQFHVTKWMTLGIEERIIISGSDLLDGYRWQQDVHNGFTRDLDNLSYTSINLLFHLGKKRTEPLYWLNPVHHTYKKLGEVNPASIADDLKKDDDDDGVPNWLDKEPNTKKDCPVDTKGRALDSDKDGIIDCDDKEPFSAPGYPVDSFGIAIIPPNPCCDTTGFSDGPDGPGGPNSGKGKKGGSGYDCSKIELPAVVFEDDKYYLDPQFYGNLHQIAERMQMCPDMKLVVTGFDESRNDQKYNEQLAWNRANAAVDYLVEKYGISRDRFIVKYQGGKKAATGTAYEKKMKNKVEFRYANDGESGNSNPPAPHPGLKAGSNK
ncbi:MAG: OmpA family protein [Chitinophagales bacterium]|nr:OmpA family protein [Chitinophagales bacterium]